MLVICNIQSVTLFSLLLSLVVAGVPSEAVVNVKLAECLRLHVREPRTKLESVKGFDTTEANRALVVEWILSRSEGQGFGCRSCSLHAEVFLGKTLHAEPPRDAVLWVCEWD